MTGATDEGEKEEEKPRVCVDGKGVDEDSVEDKKELQMSCRREKRVTEIYKTCVEKNRDVER